MKVPVSPDARGITMAGGSSPSASSFAMETGIAGLSLWWGIGFPGPWHGVLAPCGKGGGGLFPGARLRVAADLRMESERGETKLALIRCIL